MNATTRATMVTAMMTIQTVSALAPERMSVPAPDFVRPPVVVVAFPEKVRETAEFATLMPLVVSGVRVKLRLVLPFADPVYSSVPPPRTRLPAAAVELPRAPARIAG